jgi:hypothetical protein
VQLRACRRLELRAANASDNARMFVETDGEVIGTCPAVFEVVPRAIALC